MQEVTNEQEEYAQPFVDALNNLRNIDKAQHTHPPNVREFATPGTTGAIVVNPAVTTTPVTTSTTILSKVGMSGGSVTYTNLGNMKWHTNIHLGRRKKKCQLNNANQAIASRRNAPNVQGISKRNRFNCSIQKIKIRIFT